MKTAQYNDERAHNIWTIDMHKTEQAFWNNIWKQQSNVDSLHPESDSVMRFPDRSFHRMVCQAIIQWGQKPETVIELGCANSKYLPYFARTQKLQIFGLDYSEAGCSLAQQILDNEKLDGTIVQGDMFAPPPEHVGKYDIVFSWGLFEHFTDTAAALQAGRSFLRENGLMLTIVPNMTAIPGWLQKTLHREVFDGHVPLDAKALEEAHKQAGFSVLSCGYMMTFNPYVFRFIHEKTPIIGLAYRVARAVLARVIWGVESLLGDASLPNRFTSPYVVCVAVK